VPAFQAHAQQLGAQFPAKRGARFSTRRAPGGNNKGWPAIEFKGECAFATKAIRRPRSTAVVTALPPGHSLLPTLS
jgi:hypothetical protein